MAKSPKTMTPKTKYPLKKTAMRDFRENSIVGSNSKIKQNE
jgi:hypothetical protein